MRAGCRQPHNPGARAARNPQPSSPSITQKPEGPPSSPSPTEERLQATPAAGRSSRHPAPLSASPADPADGPAAAPALTHPEEGGGRGSNARPRSGHAPFGRGHAPPPANPTPSLTGPTHGEVPRLTPARVRPLGSLSNPAGKGTWGRDRRCAGRSRESLFFTKMAAGLSASYPA